MNLRNKKVLCIDAWGMYVETAVRFMRDCAEVKYCAMSHADLNGKIGVGMDGIKQVDSPWSEVDKADFIFVPSNDCVGLVEYLKAHGYPVAGVGAMEKMETDRWYGRNYQREQGLSTQESHKVVGITAIREFCKAHKNYFVKVNDDFRIFSESFKHYDWKSTEPKLDYIAYKTGPFKEEIIFICEELLDGVEPGTDAITFEGELLFPTLGGYELGKKSYIARAYQNEQEYPEPYKEVHKALEPEFKKKHTRFFYSTEMIIDKSKHSFLLDPTMRMALHGGTALQTEMIDNFTEVCYGLATGVKVNPIMKHKYGISVPLMSPEVEESFVNVPFPQEMRQWIKFFTCCKKGSDYYALPNNPPDPIACCVIALGDSVKEVVDTVKERIKEVNAPCLSSDEKGLSKAQEIINDGKLVGINF